jgi:hypothetical protein
VPLLRHEVRRVRVQVVRGEAVSAVRTVPPLVAVAQTFALRVEVLEAALETAIDTLKKIKDKGCEEFHFAHGCDRSCVFQADFVLDELKKALDGEVR